MISFDLKCALGHVFEAWFRSSADYEQQCDTGLLACPVCGASEVAKAVMAPAVAAKGNQRVAPEQPVAMASGENSEAELKAMLGALAKAQAKMLESSVWVGDSFADKARAMHYGEMDHAPIHGTTDAEQARAMLEEGLAVAPLIVPVAPPENTH